MTSVSTEIVVIYQNVSYDPALAHLEGNNFDSESTVSYDMSSSNGWVRQAGGLKFGVAAVVSWREHLIALGADPCIF